MGYIRRIRSLGFYLWHMNHMLTHMLIGMVYAWILREVWQQISTQYIILAAFGSVVIDIDHLLYFFTYGRHEWYAFEVRKLLRQGQLRTLWLFWKYNHKSNTGLATHNVYFVGFFIFLSLLSFQHDWKTGVVLFGAIVLHLIYDMFDDVMMLGHLNKSWKSIKHKPYHEPDSVEEVTAAAEY